MTETSHRPDERLPDDYQASEALDEFTEKLAAFNVFRSSDEAAADAVLDKIGAKGKVEQEIVREMATPRPIEQPQQFEASFRVLAHGFEVLYRNGARPAKLRKLGPLQPVAAYAVQQLSRFIVRSYLSNAVEAVRGLVVRREMWAKWGSPDQVALRKARIHLERTHMMFKGRALGLPTFLLGGAFVSTLLGSLRTASTTVLENRLLLVVTTLLLFLLFLGAAWAALVAAAVARRRIRLTTAEPLATFWRVMGACGNPPRDQARQFALYAIVVMLVAWLVIPAGIIFAVAN